MVVIVCVFYFFLLLLLLRTSWEKLADLPAKGSGDRQAQTIPTRRHPPINISLGSGAGREIETFA